MSFWKYSLKVIEYCVFILVFLLIFMLYLAFVGETVEVLDRLQGIP